MIQEHIKLEKYIKSLKFISSITKVTAHTNFNNLIVINL